MSKKAMENVRGLDDLDVVRFLKYFGSEIFEGTEGKEIIDNIPDEFRTIPEFKKLEKLDLEERKIDLPPKDSIQIARNLLEYFAKDDTFGPILEKSWEEYESDELFIGAAIACGFVASMILFAATTEIEGKIGNIKFRKKAASREIVEALAKAAFDSLRQTLTGM